jgi:hypothetical protein
MITDNELEMDLEVNGGGVIEDCSSIHLPGGAEENYEKASGWPVFRPRFSPGTPEHLALFPDIHRIHDTFCVR